MDDFVMIWAAIAFFAIVGPALWGMMR